MNRSDRPQRLVTGLRPDGSSHFARDEAVEPTDRIRAADPSAVTLYRIWAIDRLPVELPSDGLSAPLSSDPTPDETAGALRGSSALPGPDGVRVTLLDMPAGWTCDLHWHDTFDVLWVLSGEVTAILDGDSERLMRLGDVCIAHGTNHAWRAGPEGARVGAVRLGARRVGPLSPPPEGRRA